MATALICDFFAWCALFNIMFLLFWVVWLALAHDFVYRVHCRWLKLSVERFDAIHYAGMLVFKICIFVFNIVPYIALRIVV
ncbi:DUF6868 family protein [Psychromonas ossibalaenae]|uniref:DUF6868 family protein n=1 Tax=Psychromonas ossibalaenae TaxID=444922 RepID=UPI00036E8E52|nr:hypothetical protein [Psychromonas ossibalaenae]